ncbi:phage portal protein [Oenococcus sicerae]|uniref:Phage portal protein n=1 Tax=Oenococcus sicerae TaxID=2203724 RepID=A0AAJ1R7Q7_9LACO|nr:phage portal protein [Oenococcus sicerae]MDN6899568.1 phage portal protein [Oenococcus sicerae]
MFFEKRDRLLPSGSSGIYFANGQLVVSDTYYSAEQALKNSDVWAAVNIISADLARAKLSTGRPRFDHLLQDPTPLTDPYSFWRSMYAQMLLSGNAYAIIRDNQWLEFVPPSHIDTYQTEDGTNIYYSVRFDGSKEPDIPKLDRHSVIHLRWLGSSGGTLGLSPLSALSTEIQLKDSANALANSALSQATNPSAELHVEKGAMNKDEKAKIRSEFEAAQSGVNAGRVIITDQLVSFKPLEVSASISGLLNSVNFSSLQIAKAFMLPPDYLGSESEHSNTDQIRSSYNSTLGRYLQPVISEVSFKFGITVTANVRDAIDLDGSITESRVNNLVGSGAISPEFAILILKNSPSDLITEDLLDQAGKLNIKPYGAGKLTKNVAKQN